MGVKLVTAIILLGTFWNFFSIFIGIAAAFDLPVEANLNPAQFMFALVVALVVFGFVISTHLLWGFKSADFPTLLLKIAWVICLAVDFATSWYGTQLYVFNGADDDPAQMLGLTLVTFLIVVSTILLSRILLAKDIRGKPFLY